ncbi:MAG: type III toxin-antitoxin system ToxN/AbiQ family toxin [Blautia sp.]|nr:type III toxin-antitoxin system ToxN/AbiQ family toxin [Blautia sp.]
MHLSFYVVDSEYCNFLRKSDPLVPHTMDHKSSRPFVGIIFMIKDFHYYAPLTSPKSKHLKMKNQVDFMKINHGEWGAINFNNMIPVPDDCLHKVNLKICESDSRQDVAYKNLLANQLSWCNSHREQILKQAKKLYWMIMNEKSSQKLAQRCCNFRQNEQQCLIYHKI